MNESKLRSNFNSKIGSYLKKCREDQDLSLREVAEVAQCSPQFICNIERGVTFPPPQVFRVMNKMYKINEADFTDILMEAQREFNASLYFPKKKKTNI